MRTALFFSMQNGQKLDMRLFRLFIAAGLIGFALTLIETFPTRSFAVEVVVFALVLVVFLIVLIVFSP